MSDPRRIVVFLPNWVGDVVMATPVLRALRRRYPEAKIDYLGRGISRATLSGCRWCDRLLADESRDKSGFGAFRRAARCLREGDYDTALLLPNSMRTALLGKLGRVGDMYGYDRDGRGILLKGSLKPARDEQGNRLPMPTTRYYARLAELLDVEVSDFRLELPVVETYERQAEQMLSEAGVDRDRPIVMLNPGASFGPSKMWEPRRYAQLADLLIRRDDAQIIINAAPPEKPIAARVERFMACSPTINFAERDNSLGLLKSLTRRCDVLVTNDTGARHVAAAGGIGVVTLFGSTDPVWAEIDYPQERQVRLDVWCSPCQEKMCPQPAGPLYHQCMTGIDAERVYGAVAELLQAGTACGGGS